jgi:hypothetical protein
MAKQQLAAISLEERAAIRRFLEDLPIAISGRIARDVAAAVTPYLIVLNNAKGVAVETPDEVAEAKSDGDGETPAPQDGWAHRARERAEKKSTA